MSRCLFNVTGLLSIVNIYYNHSSVRVNNVNDVNKASFRQSDHVQSHTSANLCFELQL